MATADFNCSPTQNPCAQCGKPIARPIWSERGPDRIAFVWSCDACNYEFATIAIFATPAPDDHKIAA
jgi:ribosomal protein L37AE/L43A